MFCTKAVEKRWDWCAGPVIKDLAQVSRGLLGARTG